LVALSHLVRSWIILPLAVIFIGGVIALAFAVRWRRKGGFLDGMVTNSRIACGTWTWHVSLLLDLGFSQADAIATAGQGSCKGWLKNVSARWAQAIRDGQPPLAGAGHAHGQSLHLLSFAFTLPDADDQSAALRETALMYWERGGTVSRWRCSWLTPLVNFVVTCLIGFMVAALFTPLIELIAGLT
jgi:type II secretory pathway component PulF